MFPAGAPGAGLLLLRLHLACFLPLDPCGLMRTGTPPWLYPLIGVVSLLLLLGLLTPLAAAAAMLPALWPWIGDTAASLPATAIALLAPAAQILLGPGAWSIDARLFGRRVLVARRERGDRSAPRSPPKE